MYTRSGILKPSIRVEDHLPLVRRIAYHMASRLPANIQIDDLIQAGMLGLIDAAERYEDGQGAQFETYATQRIKGAMIDELRKDDWLPRSVRQAQKLIDNALQKLEQTMGRAPTEAEMATSLGMPLDAYQTLLLDAKGCSVFSLDEPDYEGESSSYLEFHEVKSDSDPSSELEDQYFREALVQQIESLPEREKLLMSLYYTEELNFKEIAAVLEVTESRVCQLHTQAISRLRTRLKDWKK